MVITTVFPIPTLTSTLEFKNMDQMLDYFGSDQAKVDLDQRHL